MQKFPATERSAEPAARDAGAISLRSLLGINTVLSLLLAAPFFGKLMVTGLVAVFVVFAVLVLLQLPLYLCVRRVVAARYERDQQLSSPAQESRLDSAQVGFSPDAASRHAWPRADLQELQ